MSIPKPRHLPSGNWHIQIMVDGKRISKTCATEEAAMRWAESYKDSYKKTIREKTDYERLLKGLATKEKEKLTIEEKSIPTLAEELELIDNMDGFAFEQYCANLFSLTDCFNGANIHLTRKSGDYGADIIIRCIDGLGVSIQCKRMSARIGVRSIQEVVTSKEYYRTSAAAVITNSQFTDAAKKLAKENGVVLFDRKYLIKLIQLKLQTLERIRSHSQWVDLLSKLEIVSEKRKKEKE